MVVCVPKGGPGQKMEAQDARKFIDLHKTLVGVSLLAMVVY
jgi:hypothetical protein